jgi:hypothetical protein
MEGYRKSWVIWVILFFLKAYFVTFGYSQKEIDSVGLDLFESDDFLEIRIVTDLDTLVSDKSENPSYQSARLSYKNSDSNWITLDADIRVRGNFRRQAENCDFPPLKLRIDKKNRANTIFENTREVKIVTHCQSDIPEYEQYVVLEYLIYRMYNILSDISYLTRLLKITYTDDDHPEISFEKFAFFVEDPELMEERLNGKMLDFQTVDPQKIERDHYVLISFFQYLIVNTDWSLPILHNVDLFSKDYFKPPVPVPFDFDWSGLINIPYKVPTVAGMQVRVPERIYKGPCLKHKDLKKIKELFLDKQAELFDLFIDCKYLDDKTKVETFDNLQIFYRILEDNYLFNVTFLKNCD